jgi:hypothetical protein
MHPNWPHDQAQQPAPPPPPAAAVTIPSRLGRLRVTWTQLAPYLVACVAMDVEELYLSGFRGGRRHG